MFGHFVGLALKGLKYDHALKSLSHVKLHNINYTLLFYTFFRMCLLLGKIQYQLLKWPRKTSRNGFYVSCRSNRQTETFWKIFSKSSTRTPPRMFSWHVPPTYKTPLDLWSSLPVKELAKFIFLMLTVSTHLFRDRLPILFLIQSKFKWINIYSPWNQEE